MSLHTPMPCASLTRKPRKTITVISADKKKFSQGGDPLHIDKVRRYALIGWEIGKAIPPPEQIEEAK